MLKMIVPKLGNILSCFVRCSLWARSVEFEERLVQLVPACVDVLEGTYLVLLTGANIAMNASLVSDDPRKKRKCFIV